MTARDFAYWLQGFMEVAEPQSLNGKQVKIIQDHLALVFNKVTPDRKNPLGLTEEDVEGVIKDLQKDLDKPFIMAEVHAGGFNGESDCQIALC